MRHTHACSARRGWTVAAVLAGALALASTPLFAQDLTLHGTMTAGGQQTPMATFLTANATRTGTGDGREVIVRQDAKKIVVIDNKRKTYSEMTFDDMQKMAAAARASMENLPPEAAAQMKKVMGGMGGGDVTVSPMGPGETIAGYPTQKYRVTMGSTMDIEMWVAPAIVTPTAYYDGLKAVMRANPMFDMTKVIDEYRKIKGTQLKSVTNMKMMGQAMTTTMVVTSVDKSPIPGGTFDVPAGYKLVAMGK
jgi:hypothetical protein